MEFGACRSGNQKDLLELCQEFDGQRRKKKDFQKRKVSRCPKRH